MLFPNVNCGNVFMHVRRNKDDVILTKYYRIYVYVNNHNCIINVKNYENKFLLYSRIRSV